MYLKLCEICYTKSVGLYSKIRINNFRNYHSEQVFGFRIKEKTSYQVPEETLKRRSKESNLYRLATAYRNHGHKCADFNPVSLSQSCKIVPELDLHKFGLNPSDTVECKGIINLPNKQATTIKEAEEFLNTVYCQKVAAEFSYLETEEEREWFSTEFEKLPYVELDQETKVNIAKELIRSQAFDNFLAKRFSSVKRYGAEGAESMMAFFSEIFKLSAHDGLKEIVLAMPHRGRLNLLVGMLNYPPVQMFSKLRGNPDYPKDYQATGDVLSHCISSVDLQYGDRSVHVSLLYNPSHLEAVNPVSMGKTRAKQLSHKEGDYGQNDSGRFGDEILNIQVHGDAALMGQGVNQECLALSSVPHFEIGGSIHLVVNNQVGFTTPGERGRSSRYCTDVAKIISAPVIHVNGDCPEEVFKVSKLAFEYQRKFRKDIFIDLNCYRKWGHNEMDDPTFTNPALYSIISSKGTVPDVYAENLIKEQLMTKTQQTEIYEEFFGWLNEELNKVDQYDPKDNYFKMNWSGMRQPDAAVTVWDTGIDKTLMSFIGDKSVKYPENFEVHPTILRTHVKNRLTKIAEGIDIDWATAESFAIGSLLFEGYNVRISGQDVGRGTFSHRHAMLVDQKTNNIHIPLNHIHQDQTGFLEVANSILSEEAVLGYEYGMSIESPKNLIMWEAQFGDFFNGAQIILDTFVTSGEAKWLWQSGLTILLPHGYDGAGPEHSSARIERFLQLTDSKRNKVDGEDVNMQVCHPSTPAQYFHLLRRQMVRDFRKPLVIITPKTLLRSPACTSDFTDMENGTYFKPVLGDTFVNPEKVKKILLTSGKHYYSLFEKRGSMTVRDTAIIRLESFCPFPTLELQEELAKYTNAEVFIWCQEEPENMGAWNFVHPRFENLMGRRIQFCGRPTLPAPAVGVGRVHLQQASEIVTKPFLL